MMSKISRKKAGVSKIPVTLKKAKVKATYNQVLSQEAKKTTIKGFRKGKAPLKAVEEKLGKTAIYQKVLEVLLPQVLSQTVKKHQLKPIANPKVKLKSIKEDADWQINLEIIEFPQFKLGDYQDKVRGALKTTQIWLPGDEKKPSSPANDNLSARAGQQATTDTQSLSDKRLQKVFDALLDNIEVPIAASLIEDEVTRALSKLLDQVQKLGLTIDDYLRSINKTGQQLRNEYEKTAREKLKLEFILLKIADDLKIQAQDSEVNQMISSLPDEKSRQAFSTASQRTYLQSIIRKQKTIAQLLKLA